MTHYSFGLIGSEAFCFWYNAILRHEYGVDIMSKEIDLQEFERVEEILWRGTKKQMEALRALPPDKTVSYLFMPDIDSFDVVYGEMLSLSHKCHHPPKCVKFYGNQYRFDHNTE